MPGAHFVYLLIRSGEHVLASALLGSGMRPGGSARGRGWGLESRSLTGALWSPPMDFRLLLGHSRGPQVTWVTHALSLLAFRRPSWSSSTPASGTSLPWGRTMRKLWQVRRPRDGSIALAAGAQLLEIRLEGASLWGRTSEACEPWNLHPLSWGWPCPRPYPGVWAQCQPTAPKDGGCGVLSSEPSS